MNTAEYERMYRLEDSYWWFVGRHRLVESLIRRRYSGSSDGRTPLTILDIGCGTGAMSEVLTKWGRTVSADFSELALRFSRKRGLKHLVGADAMRLPFADASFDVVVAMDVLEHLPDDRAAMCEFHRILKPGGRVVATVPAYAHLWSDHDVALMHFRRYIRREMAERLGAAGFRMEKTSYTMTMLYPVVAAQRRVNRHKPKADNPQAQLPMVPKPVNAALIRLLDVENSVATRLNLPFGLTVVCVAVKQPG